MNGPIYIAIRDKTGVTEADCMTSCLFWDESDWGITTHVMHVKLSECM